MAKRLARLSLHSDFKERIIKCNICLVTLCGCEAAYVNASVLGKLRTTIAHAIGPHSSRRSIDLVFAFFSTSKDLDPESYILYHRTAAIRRHVAKHPASIDTLRHSIMEYNSHPGLHENPEGPIGLLFDQLKEHDCRIGAEFRICASRETPIDVIHIPWQHFKKAVYDIASRTRTCNHDTA